MPGWKKGGILDIELKTAQLLVSRICHDLAGGISALSTGAELLAEEGGMPDEEALDLIASSARQSTRRLQFLRVAFGQGGGEDDSISLANLRGLTHGHLEGGRVALDWEQDNERISIGAGKLLLNLCLIGSEALPRGGILLVNSGHVDGRLGFAVSAQGDGARLTPEVQQALSVNVDAHDLTSRTVNAHFTAVLAQKLAAELEIQITDGAEVRLAVLFPPF